MKTLSKITAILLLVVSVSACSDFLEPSTAQKKPIDSIDGVRDLEALIVGAHDRLSQLSLYGGNYILFGEVRTDNAFAESRDWAELALFNYLPSSDLASEVDPWTVGYRIIANCNLIINSGVEEGENVDHVMGQAYAMRALAHMLLLDLYGQQYVDGSNLGIPYITTFLSEEDEFPKRLTVEEVQQKITDNFKQGIQLMDPSVTTPSTMMSYYAALGLLARHYMFTEEYTKAAQAAWKVINSGEYQLVSANNYLDAWGTDGNPQFLFGVAMTESDAIPIDGLYSIISQKGIGSLFQYGTVEITEELYNLFGSGDVRKDLYTAYGADLPPKGRIKYRVTGKYPDPYTNIPVIRYAEVVLTYAEALVRKPNSEASKALTYLNKIPNHRNADPYSVASIENILLERRKELAMEGQYFWTLMRTGQDIVRESLRPEVSYQEITISYGDHRLALPIPDEETSANPNIKQNTGYN